AVLCDALSRALHLGCDCGNSAQYVRADLRQMIRPIATELVLFLTPFVLYAAFLLVTRAKVFERSSWPLTHVITLAIVATLMVVVSFVSLAEFSGSPPSSTYVPAHIENGKFVPGRTQ